MCLQPIMQCNILKYFECCGVVDLPEKNLGFDITTGNDSKLGEFVLGCLTSAIGRVQSFYSCVHILISKWCLFSIIPYLSNTHTHTPVHAHTQMHRVSMHKFTCSLCTISIALWADEREIKRNQLKDA